MDNYPKDPRFREKFGPRGVLHCWATDKDDATEEPRWGRVGKQGIEDTGPLTKKRMETCDDEFVAAATDLIKRQHKDGKPFFVWLNRTHMHLFTHTKPESRGQAGRWQSPYHDTMIDHDKNVGQMLDLLDELGIADNTFVMYSSDNGPHMNSWPDGAMTPFRARKTPTGRARSTYLCWCATRARLRLVPFPMESYNTTIGCPPSWRSLVIPIAWTG
jgi:arylsulfatase